MLLEEADSNSGEGMERDVIFEIGMLKWVMWGPRLTIKICYPLLFT